ncbi:hypothetical protein PHYSODRAFT_338174 [Phytophthora sojae]|uniref:Tf2-1-like SH3-like domain-containing protein n=1 Tax=Phytophthora sojae (strain P6497) TaxID=1094619 RepID=G5A3D2_PHYSP|nr:hypothetical protein PHYSODRAFT_338174 [Phytophthora sojae]EGZ09357.1 hypothetical protein PHYSODRAFT_338174 [Phytophthora sojae]|eukprot:XP_009534218.1 hypothetical protein PHYSODRAFT_338174 [Phytophthora sojae]
MERVRPGLTKKLAHRWHGPFREKKKVDEFAYELELPDRSGYRFYLVVHVSRLKSVDEFEGRPRTLVLTSDAAAGSRKLSNLASLFLEPGFVSPGGQECGSLIQNASKGDLGLALWERRHWIRAKAVKASINNLAPTLGHRNPLVVKFRNKWAKEAVASSVVIEPSLRTSMVVAPWVAEFAAAHEARSPSPDEETKESDEGASTTESNLGVLAQAASEI